MRQVLCVSRCAYEEVLSKLTFELVPKQIRATFQHSLLVVLQLTFPWLHSKSTLKGDEGFKLGEEVKTGTES